MLTNTLYRAIILQIVTPKYYMADVVRFGVSLQKGLLDRFDSFIKNKGFSNRSQAIKDLIRESLIRKEWLENKRIAGVIILVYDHHKRKLLDSLTDIQHDHQHLIISSQHIHLDHHNCMEIVVVKGKAKYAQKLCDTLKSTKGVKYANLTMATTGSKIP